MKNISVRHIKRKAEIAEEFNTVLLLAKEFENRGVPMIRTVAEYQQELNDYITGFSSMYMTPKNLNTLDSQRYSLAPLSHSSAMSLANSIQDLTQKYSEFSYLDVENYNKKGLKDGPNQKSDILIQLFNKDGSTLVKKHFSLKQYESFSDPQVASGTYFSTLAGLAFEREGCGKFKTPTGNTFLSKDYDSLVKEFNKHYGASTSAPLAIIKQITNKTHRLRSAPRRPSNLDSIRKEIGMSAVRPFIDIIAIIHAKDPLGLKSRFLKRTGLESAEQKEILYSANKGKNIIVTFNTLSDIVFSEFITAINDKSVKLSIRQSGNDQSGQGVNIIFEGNSKSLLEVNIPLTINTNGAWAREDRWCKKSNAYIKKDHIRPGKAKELDTSTNAYVKLKKTVFNPILKQRGTT